MATLSNAPLVEAWVESRWGTPKPAPGGKITEFNFSVEDIDLFPGQFRQVLNECGFVHLERVNPSIPAFGLAPHVCIYRFRKGPGSWPCYQIGLGMFTVNQVNEGYSWAKFKTDILDALHILDRGHPLGLAGMDRFGIELRYRDGFPFQENQLPLDFLESSMTMGIRLPEEFLNYDPIGKVFSGMKIAFTLNAFTPPGHFISELAQGTINGQPGFVMDSIVRSTQPDCPEWHFDGIMSWLENAHAIHSHAFKTLIDPAFARTFK